MGHMHYYYYLVTRTTLLLKWIWKEQEDDCVRISVSKNEFTLPYCSKGYQNRVYNHINWSRF